MSAEVIDLTPHREARDLGRSLETMGFGSCPVCRSCDEVVTHSLTYWGLCVVHGLRWRIGDSNEPTLPDTASRLSSLDIHRPHQPKADCSGVVA